MIKINLLGDSLSQAVGKKPEREVVPVYAEGETGQGGSLPIAGILVGLLFASGGLGYYLILNGQVKAVEEQVSKLEAEKRDLEKYIKMEKDFQERKIVLQKKKEVLAGLKNAQKLPVHLLQELGNCLPDDVWFSEVNQRGMGITIRGESSSFEAINIFRSQLLERRQWFKDVNYPIADKKGSVVFFTISFQMKNKG